MPEYRRWLLPGGTYFLTLVTDRRRPLFADETNVSHLRKALRVVRDERPFDVVAAVVLPDHIHFLWALPPEDADFSSRVGRVKVGFTRLLAADGPSKRLADGADPAGNAHGSSSSRKRHREASVWQRRFWEHAIRDERDLERHMDYIHYNPVKHGLAECPHEWPYSSFEKWVRAGVYEATWCCQCDGQRRRAPDFASLACRVGE